MVYFDNSATSFPKPEEVYQEYKRAIISYYSNPGRSGYENALETASVVFEAREKTASLFGCEDERNVVFTPSCTYAVNMVIKGILKENDHVLISDLEHNCVLRPIWKMFAEGRIKYDIFTTDFYDETRTLSNIYNAVLPNTKLLICTHASNVFGVALPIQKIGQLCRDMGIVFCVDAAQSGGILPINVKKDNIRFLCLAAHKGLFSPMGLGVLLSDGTPLDSLVEGGTGSASNDERQPSFLPDKLEAGTLNVPAIACLSKGIDFICQRSLEAIHTKETKHLLRVDAFLRSHGATLYTDYARLRQFSPVLSFNIKNKSSEAVAAYLSQKGICVRAGLHCAALAHRKMGTEHSGTVRISPSYFTNDKEINYLFSTMKNVL